MSLAVADVNLNAIGALAPMVGDGFFNDNHFRDAHEQFESKSYGQFMKEFAPHVDTDVVRNAADVTAVASDGSVPIVDNAIGAAAEHIESGIDKFGDFMGGVGEAAEATADVVIAGTAISSAVALSALEAVRGIFANDSSDVSQPEQNGLELHEQHAAVVVADMTDGDLSLGQLSDPTYAIKAANDFAQAKQEAAFNQGLMA